MTQPAGLSQGKTWTVATLKGNFQPPPGYAGPPPEYTIMAYQGAVHIDLFLAGSPMYERPNVQYLALGTAGREGGALLGRITTGERPGTLTSFRKDNCGATWRQQDWFQWPDATGIGALITLNVEYQPGYLPRNVADWKTTIVIGYWEGTTPFPNL